MVLRRLRARDATVRTVRHPIQNPKVHESWFESTAAHQASITNANRRPRTAEGAIRLATVSEFKLRPLPKIDVYGLPAAAIDVKTRRLLDKELRAAWGERQARWQTANNPVLDSPPTLYLSCNEEGSAVGAIAVKVRIGLAHLVRGVRRRLPEWVIHFSARGTDGELQLVWPLDVGLDDIAESLLGRVPKQRVPKSEGRRFWDER